ncbi:hypothetical protein OS188_01895 [Xanthomarina sp. F1114]|uniref:hypothetical protein n=1 Tax=Xanthomarina sp. F1114 TaxID=2996019 RepID=UPI00225E22DD|nr:hypothetical protein [Xanthomarina sp. F1114]MCX7546699.1 hypothetical protein [Xanthomarina sp. F1114]
MKKTLLILAILLTIYSCSNKSSESKSNSKQWNLQQREQLLKNRNDSTSWDREMFNNDIKMIEIGDFGPFEIGVFPEPKYNLIGEASFKGLGNRSEEFKIKDKKILMNCFFVGENRLNKNRLDGMKDEVFFQVLVLTDTIDNENYNLNKSIAISRNHPDYLGQGFIKTKNNRIDYLAFQTAENNAYAIINSRIFDLSFGKTILIAPQKNKSLKSYQIKSPDLTSDSVSDYTKKLISNKQTISFFGKKENI